MYLPLWVVVVIGMVFAALVVLRWELMDLLFDRMGWPSTDIWTLTRVDDAEPTRSDERSP